MKIRLVGLFIIGALTIASTEALASKYCYLVFDAVSIDGEDPEIIVLARKGIINAPGYSIIDCTFTQNGLVTLASFCMTPSK